MSSPEAAKTAAAGAPAAEGASLLEQISENYNKAGRFKSDEERRRGQTYLEEFVRQAVKPGQLVSKDVETNVKFWIKEIDKKLSAQLNEIMHHADFQRLESTWRGLHYLVSQSNTNELMKIRVLNVKKRELFKDLESAVEFDQSTLFKKIYTEEYDQFGGHPYGMLVADYEFTRDAEDIAMLDKMSKVAAAAHAPLVSAASPEMFNFERFTELPAPRDLAKIFEGVEYAAWKSFRQSEDSRYVALTLPHVLARLPYGPKFKKVDEFDFDEAVDGMDHDKYLWMNAAWAYATRITDAYDKYGWFIRSRGVEGGGKVEGLPVHTFPTDEGDVVMKCPTEIAIPDRREFELSNLGFMPLLHCKNTDFAAFLGAQSAQKPQKYFSDDANTNAELSTKFNFILCVSRFAHYLKVMARDKIGSMMEKSDVERWLNDWINNYVTPDPGNVGEDIKARKPLAAARVDVEAVKGKPGWYEAKAYLRPHFQLETLTTAMCLVGQLPPPRPG